MKFKSVNPYNGDLVKEYDEMSLHDVNEIINGMQVDFNSWKKRGITDRAVLMMKVANDLKENAGEYAQTISLEMGKPIRESKAEVLKCAIVCEYYAGNTEKFLQNEMIETDASESYVQFDPLGIVFAIMPWNFPFWQVFRFAAPALMAGNAALLKHASNVFGSAQLIEDIFSKAGFPKNIFRHLIIGHDKTEAIIANPFVKAITLTGSEKAGQSVAMLAGKHLKKVVLELGGSNAFIVLKDADKNKTIQTALTARMLNSGQSCIAAKRLIVVPEAVEWFVPAFVEAVKNLKDGDPLSEETQIGPLARPDLAKELNEQVSKSIEQGAELLYGGKVNKAFHEPTVLDRVKPGMPAFDEETFGPLAAIIRADNEEHALQLARETKFGLGVSICTADISKAKKMASLFDDGACFINELVKSDPRLPFGGTGISGYGRELAKDGMMEFVNKKTVYIK